MNDLEWIESEEIGFFHRDLAGGARLVGQHVPGRRSVALGVWLKVGSRDEEPALAGMAHFIEHMVFKGTLSRTARDIAESVERVGGSLDAFTTKDMTCYYARVLEEHVELAAEVLGDLVCRPRFDPHDIELERQVVLEELRTAEDAPEELIGELAQAHLWLDDPLGTNILGTPESLARVTVHSASAFHARHYRSSGVVVSAAGAIDPDRLEDVFLRHLHLPPEKSAPPRSVPRASRGTLIVHPADLSQLHLALITEAPGEEDPSRRAAQLLADILGGGMSSRLFQAVRELEGLAYAVQAYTEHYEDVGLFAITLAVTPERALEALARTRNEVELLRHEGLRPGELEGAQAQVRGSFIMGLESLTNRMSHLARGEYRKAGRESVDKVLREFDAVTEDDVREAAQTILDPAALNLVALGPATREQLAVSDFARVVEVKEA
jgi:predicted Zn-dependent peptidase